MVNINEKRNELCFCGLVPSSRTTSRERVVEHIFAASLGPDVVLCGPQRHH